jgi:GTPase SAR1 family protein
MAQIAIVGGKSSGKTVLAAVLMKRLATLTDKNIILLPADYNTDEYITRVWETLRGGKWWQGTPQGTKEELRFKLDVWIEGSKTHVQLPIIIIDSAGEDLRDLFIKDRHKKPIQEKHFKDLLEYIQSSSIVILVANLKDFVGEPDGMERQKNQTVLREVVEMSTKNGKHQEILICFTAEDLYKDYIKEYFDGDFKKYFQKELPELYNAVRLARKPSGSPYIHNVAAVADTLEKPNEDGTQGYFPKPGFTSTGLTELIKQIAQSAVRVSLPNPQWDDNCEFEYTCVRGFFTCRDHRATAKIFVKNTGGAGKITVEFSLKGKTNSETVFFGANEGKLVTVTVSGLPNHRTGDDGKSFCFRTQ